MIDGLTDMEARMTQAKAVKSAGGATAKAMQAKEERYTGEEFSGACWDCISYKQARRQAFREVLAIVESEKICGRVYIDPGMPCEHDMGCDLDVCDYDSLKTKIEALRDA